MFLIPLAVLTAAGLAAWGLARAASPAMRATSSEVEPEQPQVMEQLPPNAQAGGPTGPVGALLQEGGGLLQSLGDNAPIVGVGLAATAGAAELVKAAGGSELEQNATRLNLTLAAPILVKEGVGALLGELGVASKPVKETAGETVAVALFGAALLPLYAQLKVGQGLAALLGSGEPEPFSPQLEQLLSEGERNAYKFNPPRLLKLIHERRRALKMAHLQPGTHTVRVRVSSDELGAEPARFFLLVDGKVVTPELVAVAAHGKGERQDHLFRVSLNNAQTIAVACPNCTQLSSDSFRALWVDSIWIDGVSYHPDEALAYVREGLPEIPGQYLLLWPGFLVWALKPESRTTTAPVMTRYSAADMALADASSAFLYP